MKILEQFLPILERDQKYKFFVFYGGRGGGKTIGIADCIISLCFKSKENCFCGREIQKANDDSTASVIKRRIEDLIEKGEIDSNYVKILNDKIEFFNGSIIKFVGFSDITIENLKSTNCTLAWIDEAHNLSKNTIDTLRPSVRTCNSLGQQPILIFSFNRKKINDPILVEATTRDDVYLKKINYYDNPFFDNNISLKNELAQDQKKLANGSITKEEFNNIWLGEPYLDEEVMITNEILNKCFEYKSCRSHLYLPVFGLDIAGDGGDRNVLTIIQGDEIREIKVFRHLDLGQLADRVCRYYDEYNSCEDMQNKNRIKVFYDANGVGYGFKDAMKERNHEFCIFAIKGGEEADDERYFNKRAECYGNLKNALIDGFYLDKNNIELIEELNYQPIDLAKDRIKLVDKLKIKKKLGKSPDLADSLSLCFANMSGRLRNSSNFNFGFVANANRSYKKEITGESFSIF